MFYIDACPACVLIFSKFAGTCSTGRVSQSRNQQKSSLPAGRYRYSCCRLLAPWFQSTFIVGYVEPVHKSTRLDFFINHECQPKNKQILLLANARNNQFASQLFVAVVLGDIVVVVVVVDNHVSHFTVVFRETLRIDWQKATTNRHVFQAG
jgi:hypothetical protein